MAVAVPLNQYSAFAKLNTPFPKDLAYVSRGSFGCVVRPALPNRNKNEEWQQFPNSVSKLFSNPGNYQKALNRTRKAYNITKNNGHHLNTYKFPYSSSNELPANVQRNCAFELGQPMYPTRMPWLGLSISNLQTEEQITQIRRIPIPVLLQQFYKLLQQVRAFRDAGMIHGDIRQPNVMIHPFTGVMTIIDFDWLLPATEFLGTYPLGYYSNPPESLFALALRTELMSSTEEQWYTNRMFQDLVGDPERRKVLRPYIDNYNLLAISNVYGKDLANLKPHIIRTLKDYQKTTDTPDQSKANQFLFSTFDSYGLGFTLFEFMEILIPAGRHALLDTVREIFMKMAHPYYGERMTIDAAIQAFQRNPEISKHVCPKGCSIQGGKRKTRRLRLNRRL